MIAALEEIEEEVEITTVCNAIGINRPTFYRRRRPRQGAADKPRPTPPRALSCEERTEVLELLDSEQFCDSAPEEVHATLLR